MESQSDMLKYLSDKRVNLNNPGYKIDNNYYSRVNTTISMSETTYNYGRYSQTLSSSAFGAQSTLIIPRSSMLSTCFMHFQLPAIVADQTICRGWGYRLIDNISYLWGSANVSQLSINWMTHLQLIMQSSPTSEKKSELMRLGGEEQLVATSGAIDAYVPLHLPWSTMGIGKKPFDTRTLNAPVQISIKLCDSNRIYGGTGVRPSFLTAGRLLLNQGNLGHTEASLEGELSANPALRMNYPFIHAQSNEVPVSGVAGTPITGITLNGFINADLLCILVSIVKRSDVFDGTNNSRNPFHMNTGVRDVLVEFNGLQMYNSPAEIYKLYALKNNYGAQYFQGSVINAGTVNPFASSGADEYLIDVQFGSHNCLPYSGEYLNTWRISNNVLTISFTPAETADYTIYCSYLYNGINSVNGDSLVYFD